MDLDLKAQGELHGARTAALPAHCERNACARARSGLGGTAGRLARLLHVAWYTEGETENGGTLRARDSRPTLTAFRRVLCASLAWGAPPSFKRSPGSTPSVRAWVRRWIAGDVLPHLREGGGDVPHIRRAVRRQSAIAPTMRCPPSSWRHLGGAPAEGRASQSDGRVGLSTLFRCCCAIRPWITGVRVPLEYP
jgi:hypothetical protein